VCLKGLESLKILEHKLLLFDYYMFAGTHFSIKSCLTPETQGIEKEQSLGLLEETTLKIYGSTAICASHIIFFVPHLIFVWLKDQS
jgi:hypothetical protein